VSAWFCRGHFSIYFVDDALHGLLVRVGDGHFTLLLPNVGERSVSEQQRIMSESQLGQLGPRVGGVGSQNKTALLTLDDANY
jgi:hypothetical protein